MERPKSLTITGVLGVLLLAGCTVDVSPPSDADAAPGPEQPRGQPVAEAPAQPTDPQPWSRDLDFEAGPAKIEHGQLTEGLVATDTSVQYSEQRLTYESAFEEDHALTPAEQARQRALQRAAAAGLPPPPAVAPPPVESVSSEPLPPVGGKGAQASTQRRESMLPPPPKFPPLPAKPPAGQGTETATDAQPAAAAQTAPAQTASAEPEASSKAPQWRESRLPPPPKFPPLPAKQGEAEVETETAAVAAAEPAPETPAEAAPVQQAAVPQAPAEPASAADSEAAAAFAAEAWDAPSGTILVQVSAVPDSGKVMPEWLRLQKRYPQVLQPLRLVVEEAKLGDRGVFYRVQAGAFDSKDGAAQACDTLIDLGQSCFVVVR